MLVLVLRGHRVELLDELRVARQDSLLKALTHRRQALHDVFGLTNVEVKVREGFIISSIPTFLGCKLFTCCNKRAFAGL